MAEFFNKKEEVLDVKLTPYGRRLLSKGRLKPVYYAFTDADVLYDGAYGGVTEYQNEIHGRIKDAARPKTQAVFSGIEANFNLANDILLSNVEAEIQTIRARERLNTMPLLLGTADPNAAYAPAWNIRAYKAPISASAGGYFPETANGSGGFVNIPQLDMDHTIVTHTGISEEAAAEAFIHFDDPAHEIPNILAGQEAFALRKGQPAQIYSISGDNFQDGTFLYEEQRYVFIDAREDYATSMKKNFELEVFEIKKVLNQTTNVEEDVLIQMKFLPDPKNLDEFATEEELQVTYPTPTKDYVEYYFDIDIDNGIQDQILCELDFENNRENIFADSQLEFDCLPFKFMSTTVSDFDVIEECS